MKHTFTDEIERFEACLNYEEKSPVTVDKYLRDLRAFLDFLGEKELTKEAVIAYKHYLKKSEYAVSSINSMLAAVSSFFSFIQREDLKVKGLKVQQRTYRDAGEELTREEYQRLIHIAEELGKMRLSLVIQTIASTGIRISELVYFTVEAVRTGEIWISCKNKNRKILIPKALRKKLLKYVKEQGIESGIIFRTRTGKAWNRKNIWAEMKALCEKAHVDPKKVYPHNLRKLFAREFHKKDNDIVKLADVLGHSSVNTTRIYVMSTGKEHQKKIDALGLVI